MLRVLFAGIAFFGVPSKAFAAKKATSAVKVKAAPVVTSSSKPTTPAVGSSMTVQALHNLINTGNPAKSSQFGVPCKLSVNNQPVAMTDDQDIQGIQTSSGYTRVGLSELINNNMNTEVTLNADANLIALLTQQNRLNSTTKDAYAKILLYFTLSDAKTGKKYRFYLDDPMPPKIIQTNALQASRGQTAPNPVALKIAKWNVK